MQIRSERRLGFLSILFASMAMMMASGTLQAQSIYGALRGAVTDASGAAVGGAKVTLTNEGTSDARSTETASTGDYAFSQVTPGTFTVSVEAQGFKKVERKGVAVGTQANVEINVALEVGAVTESVMVTSEVPLIDTATASQGQQIDNQKLVELPNTGRNPFIMSKLAPNIQQVGNPSYMRMQDQSGSSQISFVGGPVGSNNYLVDGVPITDMRNRAVIIPSLEAVQEVKIQTNTYDAEIGRTGGGMFNTLLKSGSNQYHGSGGYILREADWQANAFFANRAGIPRTPQPNKTYYGAAGGAIRLPKYNGKDKSFFWLALEGYRDTQSNSGSTAVPTAEERVGNFSNSRDRNGNLVLMYDPTTGVDANSVRTPFPGNIIPASRINPVGRAIAATFPNPATASAFGAANLSYSAVLPSKAGQGVAKIDHRFTNWWTANMSYMRYHSNEPGEDWFKQSISSPQQWTLDRLVNATAINNTFLVNPTTVVTARYGFNRFPNDLSNRSVGYDITQLGLPGSLAAQLQRPMFPVVQFQNFYAGDNMGVNGNNNYFVPYSRNIVVGLSKFIGRHSLKAGVDFRSISNTGVDYGGSNEGLYFQFDDRFTRRVASATGGGSDLASMLLGAPFNATGFQGTKLYENIKYYSGFFQDDIRVNSRLTINAGLRWEKETGLMERFNRMIVGFDPNAVNSLSSRVSTTVRGAVMFAGKNGNKTSTGNYYGNRWSPRFGLAYKVNDKTVVRGGWGIIWAPPIFLGSVYNPEGATALTQPLGSNDGFNTPLINLSNPFPNGLNRPVGTANGDATGLGISMTIFDKDAKSTYIQQFSFDIQRQLPWGIAASVGYAGSRSFNLMIGMPVLNINTLESRYASLGSTFLSERIPNPAFLSGGPGIVGTAQVSRAQTLRPFPAYGNINLQFSDRNLAQYDSVVFKVQKNLSNGVSLLAAYTWSKNFDRSSGGLGNNLNGGAAQPQDPNNLEREWSLSNFDATRRWTMSGTYDLPFGRGKKFASNINRAGDMLLGGWRINAVNVINSGFPINITQNTNNNAALMFTGSQRPNATGVNPETTGAVGDRINNWINPQAFTQAPALTFGNVSRTLSMRGPTQYNWDISLFKDFKIGEKYKFQYRLEALNATNTPYFRSPNAQVGNANFGRVLSQGNFARFIQMAFRFQF